MATYHNQEFIFGQLSQAGYLSAETIDAVSGSENPLSNIVSGGHLSSHDLAYWIAQIAGVDFYDLSQYQAPLNIGDLVSGELAHRYNILPIEKDDFALKIAVTDPFELELLDNLTHQLSQELQVCVVDPELLAAKIAIAYPKYEEEEDISTLDMSEILANLSADEADDAPVILLVEQMLLDAINMNASDIHIEPMETNLVIRFRVDGKLIVVAQHPKKLLPSIIARIKVMTGTMSIAEKRLPQDGRIQTHKANKTLDLRVSSVPSNHGESIVMRVLDKSALTLGLSQLGFLSDDEATFKRLMRLPDGVILVTGPTGSGKSTTLYGCLNLVNKPDCKIITAEDPVEYEMPGINQVMVRPDIGMTFAAALRSMLRQAPNIIMVGEIRDEETATIAINAALTGHLVLSTLHTNDAPSAVARLSHIGVKKFLIASAVRAVLAQRLVRKVCVFCKEPYELTPREMQAFNLDASQLTGSTVMHGTGCDKCSHSGYKGRAGVFEIFEMNDAIRHFVNRDITTDELRHEARELGMRTMREDGIRKVLSGMTTVQEVLSVTSNY